jgi:CRP/FNR family transcriptional regulator, cyclic AMP receptor protein
MRLDLLLRRSPALSTLTDGDIASLTEAFLEGTHRAGHVFIHEGAQGDDVFLLVAGEVAVLRRGVEINRLRPGALFGLMSLIDSGPRGATCRAVGECRVARLHRAQITALQEQSAALALAFQRAIAKQLAADFRHLNALIREQVGEFGAELLKK